MLPMRTRIRRHVLLTKKFSGTCVMFELDDILYAHVLRNPYLSKNLLHPLTVHIKALNQKYKGRRCR